MGFEDLGREDIVKVSPGAYFSELQVLCTPHENGRKAKSMLPAAYISHQVEGRMRIRIPSRRRDKYYFDLVTRSLRECEGILALRVNALTGSVLIIHLLNVDTIAEYAERNGLFTLAPVEIGLPSISEGISNQVRAFDEQLKTKTSGALDLSALAFLGLLIASAAQLAKKNIWPAGATLLWYAANVLSSGEANRKSPKP